MTASASCYERPERRGASILAIDPGPERSAWVELEGSTPTGFGIDDNDDVLEMLWNLSRNRVRAVVIERIASYGMAVGAEVFETCVWTGRFMEAAGTIPVERITRLQVKLALCHDSRAKDANVRAAVIDTYGGVEATRKGGPLHGMSKDVWAAMGVALTHLGLETERRATA